MFAFQLFISSVICLQKICTEEKLLPKLGADSGKIIFRTSYPQLSSDSGAYLFVDSTALFIYFLRRELFQRGRDENDTKENKNLHQERLQESTRHCGLFLDYLIIYMKT